MKWIFLFLLSLYFPQEYPYLSGKPTTRGIDYYSKTEQKNIVEEIQSFFKDTIYNYSISTDNLSLYQDYDTLELGRTYYPDDIIITNEPKYKDYDIHKLSKFKKLSLAENDKFCRGVILHELTHVYCSQLQMEMKRDTLEINSEYNNINIFPSIEKNFGAEFIEEGVAEYVPQKMGEAVMYNGEYIPQSVDELLAPVNRTNVIYKYGCQFVRKFLDASIKIYGSIKPALIIMYHNRPPTYQEILNPDLYFKRLSSF